MKMIVINHKKIFVELTSVCFWIVIADKHLRFLQTKYLQCTWFEIMRRFPLVTFISKAFQKHRATQFRYFLQITQGNLSNIEKTQSQ